MLGHFSTESTLDTYAHVKTAPQNETAKTIGRFYRMLSDTAKIEGKTV